jgi:diacylglycerol kinase (ATP)
MRAVALLGPNATEKDVSPFSAAARIPIPIHAALAANSPPDVVLIFGGDGTVHRHLPALVATGVPALIVPTGSGNDFARAIGITSRATAVKVWAAFCRTRSNVREIDVGEIQPTGNPRLTTGDLFCCVAGAGIDADVNRRANAQPRCLRGHGGYALSVAQSAIAFRPKTISVTYEDAQGNSGEFSEPALMCAFANAKAYGHGIRIAPEAELDDGLLDLIFVRKARPARLLTVFPSAYFGRHLGLPEVEYRRVRRLRIATKTPLDIYADGEFICKTPAEVTVRPRVLKVIGNR